MISAKRLSAAVLAALLFATSIAMCGCDAGGGDKKGKNGKVPPNAKKQFQTCFQDCVQMSENVNFFVTYFDHDCAIVKPSRKWNELVLRR